MSESKFDVDAGWDGPDWRSGFYGIVFDSRRDGDDFIEPCFMKVDATPEVAFFGWSYWDICENSKKFIKKVETTGDATHDISKDGPLFVDLALFCKENNSQDKIYFENQFLTKCRLFLSKKFNPNKIFATEYPAKTVERLELELAALGMTYAEYFERLEKLCDKIYHTDVPEPKSNWVYPF